jgi:hypothetical protein
MEATGSLKGDRHGHSNLLHKDDLDFSPFYTTRPASEEGVPEWEIKLGKTSFSLTVALALWFLYWLNGIQCPC